MEGFRFALALTLLVQASSSFGHLPNDLLNLPSDTALEKALEKELGYTFNSSGLLRDALTHASYSRHNNGPLHLLGISIIRASIYKNHLARNWDATKEELEALSSRFSSTKACARRASELGLGKLVKTDTAVDRKSSKVLSVAFHALFGAITMDSSAEEAMAVFWKIKDGAEYGNVVM